MSEYLNRQIEARQQAWHAAKALLDGAAAEKRDLTAEEEQSYSRMMADIDERGQKIKDLQAAEARALEIESAIAEAPEVRAVREVRPEKAAADLRALLNGDVRSLTFERRDLNTSDDSAVVPQDFLSEIQRIMTTVGPMTDPSVVRVINTAGGNDMKVPVQATRPEATAIAEGTSITALDPTFSSITMKAQKVAVLTKVSRELLTDEGVNIEQFLAEDLGIALGVKVNNLLTLGTGTVVPNGIVTAAGSGITGGTALSGGFTGDNLIDLAHSVDGAYVRNGAGWMMRRSTIGAVRKLKDNSGRYLYEPAATVGAPDILLGAPIYENPDVAAVATSAKSVLFGGLRHYLVRVVGGLEIARSEDAYFAEDEIGIRATIRVWGDIGQSAAVKTFQGNAA
jgi:HK97 family phage major capsid protein